MGIDNLAFWLFLAATVVASLTFVSIAVWVDNRLKERKEYYRFEFRKRLVESGAMDGAAFTELKRYEHELGLQRGRQKLLVAGFVLVGVGAGLCLGFQYLLPSVWRLGFIPVCLGLSLLAYGFLVAPKASPGRAPLGWSPDSTEQD